MPEKSTINKALELLDELEECEGPCGKLCLHCPEAYALAHIKKVVNDLIAELEDANAEIAFGQTLNQEWQRKNN